MLCYLTQEILITEKLKFLSCRNQVMFADYTAVSLYAILEETYKLNMAAFSFPGSDLGPETGCRVQGFLWFFAKPLRQMPIEYFIRPRPLSSVSFPVLTSFVSPFIVVITTVAVLNSFEVLVVYNKIR